jgi:hypothetical protein
MKKRTCRTRGLRKSSGNSLWKNKRSPRTSRRFTWRISRKSIWWKLLDQRGYPWRYCRSGSQMDWIPVMKMLQGERENYYIEQELHHRVVGQKSHRSRQWRSTQKSSGTAGWPVGTFLFLGTTGVEKTELAKPSRILVWWECHDPYRHERIPRTP